MAEERDTRRVFTSIQKNAIYDRQKGKCWECGKPLPATIAQYHHLKGHSKSGKTVTDNGVALHPNCHVEIHKEEQLKKADTRPKTTGKTQAKPKAKANSAKRKRRRRSDDPFGINSFKLPSFKI
jgi:hypothetical protein